MSEVFTSSEYTGINYPRYFKTLWWQKIKVQYIYSNKNASCYICESRVGLLLHHEIYNLFHEKLNHDVFTLCYDCHTQVHFYLRFFKFKTKTKLETKYLKKRRLHLRFKYLLRNGRYGRALIEMFKRTFI